MVFNGEAAKKEKWVNNVIKSCRDTSIISKKEKKKLVIGFCGFKTKNRKIYEDGQLMVY
jgi:hypothetical protein